MGAEEVSLTDEDRKVKFIKARVPDILSAEVSSSFAKFSLPDAEEGFDRVEFSWESEEQCKEYFRKWMLDKKRTERVDNLKPGEWFTTQNADFKKALSAWKNKQREWKDPVARKKAAEKKKKAEEEKKKAEGDSEAAAEERTAEEPKMDINVDDLDPFSV